MLAVAIAVAVGVGWSRSGSDGGRDTGSVALVGDSLNVGTLPYLGEQLSGWRIRDDSMVGRFTAEGLLALEEMRGREPVVVSLGTNDPIGASATFAADVRRALRIAGDGRCLVWATIWRENGPDDDYNAVLRAIAAQDDDLRVLDWAAMLEAHPSYLAPDGIHGSPAGYAARAEEAARLVRACPGPPAAAS